MPKQPAKRFTASMLAWPLCVILLMTGLLLIEAHLHKLSLEPLDFLYPLLFGATTGSLVAWLSISRQQAREEASAQEARLLEYYHAIPAMLHSMDAQGRLIMITQTWLDRFGYRQSDIIGRDFFSLLAEEDPDQLKQHHLENLRQQGQIRDRRYQLRHANGSTIPVALSETARTDFSGNLVNTQAVMVDLSPQQAAEERIERLAYFDTLTGLPNRTLLTDRIFQAMAQARRDDRQIGIFFFDLDRFKMINDTQGHAVGDLVLRSVAQRLKKFIREGDTFARLGGDEFVIVQADPNHDPSFIPLARRILETLNEPFRIDSREFFTTASVGVAVYPLDGEDPQALLKSADTAMYVAKSRGRNNYQFFSREMNAAAQAKSHLERRLRAALGNEDLRLHYQALVDLSSGKVVGVEALLRLRDEHGQPIPTAKIIAVAEECGLIYPLGEWTLREACRQAKAWQDAGLPKIRMAINLSGHHIRQINFIDRIEEILEQTGLEPQYLEIELGETSVMGQVHEIIMAMTDLKVRGIRLAIDDFGSGYSSLLYLMHFPIYRIKIAQEFIQGIGQRKDYPALTEAILAMASSLDLSVSAVGVETAAQAAFLRSHGCQEVQGNYFSAVLTAEEFAALLERGPNLLQDETPSTLGPDPDDETVTSHKVH